MLDSVSASPQRAGAKSQALCMREGDALRDCEVSAGRQSRFNWGLG